MPEKFSRYILRHNNPHFIIITWRLPEGIKFIPCKRLASTVPRHPVCRYRTPGIGYATRSSQFATRIIYLPKLSFVAGDVPGTVTVTITTKNGDYLGATSFTYVDRKKEMMMEIINSNELLGEFLMMLGKQYGNVETEENSRQTNGKVKLCHSLVMSVHGLV